MSRTRNYDNATLGIQRRFFEVVEELVSSHKIKGGIAGYCEIASIDRRHFYTQRKDHGRGYFEVAWILPLIDLYGVAPMWLLFGRGRRLRKVAA